MGVTGNRYLIKSLRTIKISVILSVLKSLLKGFIDFSGPFSIAIIIHFHVKSFHVVPLTA